MADALTLPAPDMELFALCADAAMWLWNVEICAKQFGLTVPQGIEAMRPRLHTAYYPAAERRAARHGLYASGIRTAPRRESAPSLRAHDRAVQMGFAS